jgi:hypothetical protein
MLPKSVAGTVAVVPGLPRNSGVSADRTRQRSNEKAAMAFILRALVDVKIRKVAATLMKIFSNKISQYLFSPLPPELPSLDV